VPVLDYLNETVLEAIHRHDKSILEISTKPRQDVLSIIKEPDTYWLSTHGPRGIMPLAPPGYQFFRNVRDFGAVGDGMTDDTVAINRAAAWLSANNSQTRCGDGRCASSTTLGALVYFPRGTYLVSSPIAGYFYTQFVGDPTADKPAIKGAKNFTGIALLDADPYVPSGGGRQWYLPQDNVLKQVRNLVFDMTEQPRENWDQEQRSVSACVQYAAASRADLDLSRYVPTGIHWPAGRGTSITNCDFKMAISDSEHGATASECWFARVASPGS
jgi:glucan 1,3-beta-glucosidase